MRTTRTSFSIAPRWLVAAFLGCLITTTYAQTAPTFSLVQIQTNKEMRLKLVGTKGATYRIDAAPELTAWEPLISLSNTAGTIEHLDSAAPYWNSRFYRASQLTDTTLPTGDYLATDNGDAIVHPVNHATMVICWAGLSICVDPADGYISRLQGLPHPDLILVTHEHSDHYSTATINAIKKTNTILIVSKSVFAALPLNLKTNATQMTNGATADILGLTVKAIPAYNLTSSNHPKGNGNGYLLTVGGKNFYISGDTDDSPEMRALTGIDVAFLCMDGVYTMNMTKAASAARQFRPKVIFPYHYNTQNPATFKQLVGTDLGLEVRLRKWE